LEDCAAVLADGDYDDAVVVAGVVEVGIAVGIYAIISGAMA